MLHPSVLGIPVEMRWCMESERSVLRDELSGQFYSNVSVSDCNDVWDQNGRKKLVSKLAPWTSIIGRFRHRDNCGGRRLRREGSMRHHARVGLGHSIGGWGWSWDFALRWPRVSLWTFLVLTERNLAKIATPYALENRDGSLMTDLLPTFLAFLGCRGSKKSENQTGLLSWGFGFFVHFLFLLVPFFFWFWA